MANRLAKKRHIGYIFPVMGKGIFITATSTDVGKTVFSAICCLILARAGYKTVYYKPIQSGAVAINGHWQAPDCIFVENLLQSFPGCTVYNTYLLKKPASPHYAARLEGCSLLPEKIHEDYQSLAKHCDYLIVEGAGGLYVPLDEQGTLIADIPVVLGLNTLLIAPAGLGTINHTALSWNFACSKGIRLAAILLISGNLQPTDLEQENRAILAKITFPVEVFLIPAAEDVDVEQNRPGNLAEQAAGLAKQFDIRGWINA